MDGGRSRNTNDCGHSHSRTDSYLIAVMLPLKDWGKERMSSPVFFIDFDTTKLSGMHRSCTQKVNLLF